MAIQRTVVQSDKIQTESKRHATVLRVQKEETKTRNEG